MLPEPPESPPPSEPNQPAHSPDSPTPRDPSAALATNAAIAALEAKLPHCLASERKVFSRRLRGLRRALRAGQLAPQALAAVTRDFERSASRRARRAAAVPAITFDGPSASTPALPVVAHRDEIAAALARAQVIIVAGDTGSGKTTVLPKIALAAGRGVDGAIALTQPRRIAARSVAAWIARDLGTALGQAVGYKVRFDDRTNAGTLVRVVTDGVLLAELEHDPLLARYDTIILDEAHERSLNIDFLLGYLKRLLPRRPDLKLIVSSATLDTERFAAHFNGAPIVTVGGRMHPIEVRYHAPTEDEADQPVVERVVSAVNECIESGPGDILVFLGGERDILDCADALRGLATTRGASGAPGAASDAPAATATSTEILPLFARLTAAEQDRIFAPKPGGGRRIILATNIAETSVTVPGIRFVVDTGVARIARWSGKNRVLRLPIEPVSRASADQRKGRCGRVGPGICVRLYGQEDFEAREPFTPPELLRTNLAAVILQMKSLGLGEVKDFPFIDAPSPRLVAEGLDTLTELGALDKHHALTPLGRAMGRLPVDPRIARMVLAAVELNCLPEALVVAAALSTQDPRERPAAEQAKADLAHHAFRDQESDFASCLTLWRAWRSQSAELGSSALKRWARSSYLSHVRLREWTELTDQLTRLIAERLSGDRKHAIRASSDRTSNDRSPADRASPDRRAWPVPTLGEESNLGALHRAVLAGFPSHIAQRADEGDYLMPGGGRFHAFPGSVLARRSAPWIVSAEIVDTGRRWGRMLARVQGDWIESVAPHLVTRTRSEPHWVRANGQVAAWERLSYGCLTLVPRRRVPYGPVAPAEARNIFIQAALVEGDCDIDAPFVHHNDALMRRVEALEAKRRERGLLVESEARFAFFDERIPAHVHSLPTFRRWRHDAERRDPRVLFMCEADVLQHEPDPDMAARFPDALEMVGGGALGAAGGGATGAERIPLRYEHTPGTDGDGVTMQVSIRALHRLDAHRAEWLVPGLLAEKVEALLRTLPKRLRLRFFPLKDFATGAVETMPFAQGVLLERLADHLAKLTGTPIAAEDFAPAEISPHLRMHVEVLDDAGTVLARGQDVSALRVRLASLAHAVSQADLRRAFGAEWHREGIAAFDLPSFPERLEATLDGRRVTAYPALAAVPGGPGVNGAGAQGATEHPSVRLELTTDAARAERTTRAGLRRLFAIAARDALSHHLDYLPELPELASAYEAATQGTAAELRDELALAAAQIAFIDGRPLVRSTQAFELRLDEGSPVLWGALHQTVDRALRILGPAAEVADGIANAPPVWQDIAGDLWRRLAQLVPLNVFTRDTPFEEADLPRYLRALQVRMRKLSGGGIARDRENQAQVARWEAEIARAEATLAAEGSDPGVLASFRRMLEEFHVSLFAQEVRTAMPMSAQRLERAWLERTSRRQSAG